VKAIASAPDVIKMMGEYPQWVEALGAAYAHQADDVMRAVQSLRARAQASGALTTTPQQVVSMQGDSILVQPAQPDLVYVPVYNPSIVYSDYYSPAAAGFVTYGCGIWTGFWLSDLNCDWHNHCVCWGSHWHHGHGGDGDGRHGHDWQGSGGNAGARWGPQPGVLARGEGARSIGQFQGVASTGRSELIPGRRFATGPISTGPAPRGSSEVMGRFQFAPQSGATRTTPFTGPLVQGMPKQAQIPAAGAAVAPRNREVMKASALSPRIETTTSARPPAAPSVIKIPPPAIASPMPVAPSRSEPRDLTPITRQGVFVQPSTGSRPSPVPTAGPAPASGQRVPMTVAPVRTSAPAVAPARPSSSAPASRQGSFNSSGSSSHSSAGRMGPRR
jgi:hypothetical protein